jgi:hypothetical protein
VPDQFDVSLEDSDLLGEVELTTNLIIAASEADATLSQQEVDRLLGLEADDDAQESGDNGSSTRAFPVQKSRNSA